MMKIIRMIIIILTLLMISGCYDYRELNTFAITMGVGIDITEDNNYMVTLQVVNTKKESEGSDIKGPTVLTYTGIGKSLDEAFKKVSLDSPKNIYLNHIQIVIISEELARQGINDILDYFFRNTETIKSFYMVLAKSAKAKDIMDIVSSSNDTSITKIKSTIMTNTEVLGISEEANFSSLISKYISKKIELSLPVVKIISDDNIEKENDVILDTIGVFKGDKLQGFLTDEESIALSFIKGQISRTLISYTCGDNKYIVTEVIDPKVSINANKNRPNIEINIKAKANITEVACILDLQDSSTIKDIEKNIEREIESLIITSINTINKEYNTDIYGFRNYFYKANPDYYYSIRDTWYEETFTNLNINIKADITIKQKGSILGVITNE